MGFNVCRRCGRPDRRPARFCATCGCSLRSHRAHLPSTPQQPKGQTFMPWLLLIGMLLLAWRPESPQPRGLIYSDRCRLVTGLVVDFPLDSPPTFSANPHHR